MALRLERTPDDRNVAAILYGPVVLAGDVGPIGLPETTVFGINKPIGDPVPVPKLRARSGDLETWMKPVSGKPLYFRTEGAGEPSDVDLVPFYKLFDVRYTIYWNFLPAAE